MAINLCRGYVIPRDDEVYGDPLQGVVRPPFEEVPPAVNRDRDALKDRLRQVLRRCRRKTSQTDPW